MDGADLQLIAAIGALWAVITALGGGAFRFLLEDRKQIVAAWEKRLAEEQADCAARIVGLETKLDASAAFISRQTDSMQKQLDQQAALLAQQSQLIAALQAAARGGSP